MALNWLSTPTRSALPAKPVAFRAAPMEAWFDD